VSPVVALHQRALSGFVLNAAATLTTPIQDTHKAIADRVFRSIGPASAPVQVVHDSVAAVAYGSVRTGFRAAAGGVRLLPSTAADPEAQSDLALAAQAAANGFFGDRMAREGDDLTFEAGLVHDRRPLLLDPFSLRATFPDASSTVVVFVHGLAQTERCWWDPPGHSSFAGPSYGDRLQDELGWTPVYFRYNSGLHISDNGGLLAEAIEELVSAWPVPVEQVVVVGHSMGGLVSRSACLQASAERQAWVGKVAHVVCIGTPHTGAPLERFVNRAVGHLARLAESKPVADVLELRSDGVRDLRFGYLLEDDWRDADPAATVRAEHDPPPNLEGASHWFASASLCQGSHPVDRVIGDLLVLEESAVGPARAPDGSPLEGTDTAHFPGVDHLVLCNHPAVYAQLREWVGP
jgi:pimeloyl-ACP methyl ester carboxylesterase